MRGFPMKNAISLFRLFLHVSRTIQTLLAVLACGLSIGLLFLVAWRTEDIGLAIRFYLSAIIVSIGSLVFLFGMWGSLLVSRALISRAERTALFKIAIFYINEE